MLCYIFLLNIRVKFATLNFKKWLNKKVFAHPTECGHPQNQPVWKNTFSLHGNWETSGANVNVRETTRNRKENFHSDTFSLSCCRWRRCYSCRRLPLSFSYLLHPTCRVEKAVHLWHNVVFFFRLNSTKFCFMLYSLHDIIVTFS